MSDWKTVSVFCAHNTVWKQRKSKEILPNLGSRVQATHCSLTEALANLAARGALFYIVTEISK